MKAKQIMTRQVVTVRKDYTVGRLIRILKDNRITGAPVVDAKGKLIGIVSVKDLVSAVADLVRVHLSIEEINGMRGRYNWVEGFMTKNVITVEAEDEVKDIFKLMVEKHIHRVPVMENGVLVGIISTSDAHKAIIKYIEELS